MDIQTPEQTHGSGLGSQRKNILPGALYSGIPAMLLRQLSSKMVYMRKLFQKCPRPQCSSLLCCTSPWNKYFPDGVGTHAEIKYVCFPSWTSLVSRLLCSFGSFGHQANKAGVLNLCCSKLPEEFENRHRSVPVECLSPLGWAGACTLGLFQSSQAVLIHSQEMKITWMVGTQVYGRGGFSCLFWCFFSKAWGNKAHRSEIDR